MLFARPDGRDAVTSGMVMFFQGAEDRLLVDGARLRPSLHALLQGKERIMSDEYSQSSI